MKANTQKSLQEGAIKLAQLGYEIELVKSNEILSDMFGEPKNKSRDLLEKLI